MVFYVDLGHEAEEQFRKHAKRLGRSIDSLANEAIEQLVKEYEGRTARLEDGNS